MEREVRVVPDTKDWLAAALRHCRESFLVVSPFVTRYIVPYFTEGMRDKDRTLITRFTPKNYAARSSDLRAVTDLHASGVSLFDVQHLHAKVFIVDSRTALVTSANATRGGMVLNRECGIAVTDHGLVAELKSLIERGLGSGNPLLPIDHEGITSMQRTVAAVEPRWVAPGPGQEEDWMPSVVLEVKDMDSFLANLTGWQRLVLQGILSLQERAFSLSAVYEACAKSAQESFPGNAHVNAKIRQQLQQLRDVGVIEFVDDQGNYELLISTH